MPMIGGLRFRLVTDRFTADSDEAKRRREGARDVLRILDQHLQSRQFLVAERYTIADIATFAYSHVTEEAGIDTTAYTAFGSWLDRVGSQPRFVDDLQPYPPNASAMVGRSMYG
jgi:glutathione S-transferase